MMIIGDPTVNAGNTFSSTPYTAGPLTAGEAELHRQSTCPGECTQDFAETINVFAQFYHMHNYGSRMFTEKYATAAAGGANLGVVGGRIDFWDNGYQQALATDYTVAPGETLQTHCFYSTTEMTDDVDFGVATANEMCQLFAFYYPAQVRGVNDADEPEPFAMCGLYDHNNIARTVCGSLSQKNGGFIVNNGQVDKSDTTNKDDPLSFGSANLGAVASMSAGTCTLRAPSAPSAPLASPYPMSPPSPALPPGSETATVYKTKVEFIASGAVSDVTPAEKFSIASAFANTAGVDVSAVEVDVQAASVRISVVVTSPTSTAATTVSSAFTSTLTSSSAVTTLLSSAGVTAISVPQVSTYTATVAVVPSAPSKRTLHLAHAVCMSLAFSLLMPLAMAFPLFLRKRLDNGKWLLYHKVLQVSALLVATVGFGIGVAMVDGGNFSTAYSSHNALGLVIIILVYVQVTFGFLRPHKSNMSTVGGICNTPAKPAPPENTPRRAWVLSHRLLALAIPAMAISQVITGVAHPAAAMSSLGAIYGVFFGFLGASLAFWAASWFWSLSALEVAPKGAPV